MSEQGKDQTITRRGFFTVAAATIAPVLAVLGLDKVSRIQPTEAEAPALATPPPPTRPDALSPAVRATVDEIKFRSAGNNAALEEDINDLVRQKKDEAAGVAPRVDAKPPSTAYPIPSTNKPVSQAVDGLEIRPIASTPSGK